MPLIKSNQSKVNIGTLFITATPIGNLEDITLRAIKTLQEVDLIVCEDTRVSRKLLSHLNIRKPLISLHQHSNEKIIGDIIDRLHSGSNIAYITDSGTPGISDPGHSLIRRIRENNQETRNNNQTNSNPQYSNFKSDNNETPLRADLPAGRHGATRGTAMKQSNNITIIPIPGPSAVASAVSVSGLVNKEFYFAGFLPKKKGRQTELKKLSTLDAPIVIYESAPRMLRTLTDIEKYFGEDREIFLAREMTKVFEEHIFDNVKNIIANFSNITNKGEYVLIVGAKCD